MYYSSVTHVNHVKMNDTNKKLLNSALHCFLSEAMWRTPVFYVTLIKQVTLSDSCTMFLALGEDKHT